MRLFAIPIALLAALPALAAEPVQVQLNVTLLTGPKSMLDRPEIREVLPKNFAAIKTCDAARLAELARQKCSAKLAAEPKLVTLSGRVAHFLSGGQQAVLNGPGTTHFEEIGTDISLLPIVMENGHIYLESRVRVRNVNQQRGKTTSFGFVPGFDERSSRAALELDAGQSMVVSDRCEHGSQLIIVTPTLFIAPPAAVKRPEPVAVAPSPTPFVAPPTPIAVGVSPAPMPATNDQAKHVAAMLVREYQQACAAKNSELATKLAHMAVELDPMCFKSVMPVETRAATPLSPCKPQNLRPDPDFPLEKELKQENEHTTLRQRMRDLFDRFSDLGTLIGGETWPSSYYLEHRPQYFRPDP